MSFRQVPELKIIMAISSFFVKHLNTEKIIFKSILHIWWKDHRLKPKIKTQNQILVLNSLNLNLCHFLALKLDLRFFIYKMWKLHYLFHLIAERLNKSIHVKLSEHCLIPSNCHRHGCVVVVGLLLLLMLEMGLKESSEWCKVSQETLLKNCDF